MMTNLQLASNESNNYINQLMEIISNTQRSYIPIKIDCSYIVARDKNGTVLTWQKPSWGRMTIEHDGYRTVIERFNTFNLLINTYINYDLVSVEVSNSN